MARVGTEAPLPLELEPGKLATARSVLRMGFPKLGETFQITSHKTLQYNCIAWAAQDQARWWWPHESGFWPLGAPREQTVAAFVAAFSTLGYAACKNGLLDPDIEKVAIYARGDVPTHMARQLPSGAWTSKMGPSWDIVHLSLDVLEGLSYGTVVQFLNRPRAAKRAARAPRARKKTSTEAK